jgi:hypothetical protein
VKEQLLDKMYEMLQGKMSAMEDDDDDILSTLEKTMMQQNVIFDQLLGFSVGGLLLSYSDRLPNRRIASLFWKLGRV